MFFYPTYMKSGVESDKRWHNIYNFILFKVKSTRIFIDRFFGCLNEDFRTVRQQVYDFSNRVNENTTYFNVIRSNRVRRSIVFYVRNVN